jgi:hypothetical protein
MASTFWKTFVVTGALLLPLGLAAQTPPSVQDRDATRQDRRGVRNDRKDAVKSAPGNKSADRQAARNGRKDSRSERQDTRQTRKQETNPKQ